MPKFMNLNKVLMNEAGEHGAEGGGGSGGDDVEALKQQLADLQSQFDKVNAKKDELLTETKQAKEAKRQAEQEAQAKAEEAAKKAGDYESLHKSAMAKLQATEEAHNSLLNQIAGEKLNNAAMKIAIELADGSNAELLSAFISKRLKYDGGDVKVTDDKGNLTISSLTDLQKEFSNDARYAALLKGNQSSGGGAAGGKSGGGAAKVYTRAEFRALTPVKQAEVAKQAREGKATIEN